MFQDWQKKQKKKNIHCSKIFSERPTTPSLPRCVTTSLPLKLVIISNNCSRGHLLSNLGFNIKNTLNIFKNLNDLL